MQTNFQIFTVSTNNQEQMMETRSMQLPPALSGGTDGDHYTGVQIKAKEIRATKEWQQNITQDLRDHLVKKL